MEPDARLPKRVASGIYRPARDVIGGSRRRNHVGTDFPARLDRLESRSFTNGETTLSCTRALLVDIVRNGGTHPTLLPRNRGGLTIVWAACPYGWKRSMNLTCPQGPLDRS